VRLRSLPVQPLRKGGGTAPPTSRYELTSELFGSLPAFLEAVANHVQKLVYRHPHRLRFVGVEIPEGLGPRSASGATFSVLGVLKRLPHPKRSFGSKTLLFSVF
jgi:hypothetical protein